jgi:hypothetical protein
VVWQWMQNLRQNNHLKNGAKVFLVGTQMDLAADKLSTTSDAKAHNIAQEISAVKYVLARVATASAPLPLPTLYSRHSTLGNHHSLRVMAFQVHQNFVFFAKGSREHSGAV